MTLEQFTITTLLGLSSGLLLFMLSSGLTLIFSMMGVLNFAHASFYMLGAYFGYSLSRVIGFWPALILAPWLVGVCGALFERLSLRKVHKYGHVPELLVTFGLSYVLFELTQLIWGRIAVEFKPPELLQGPAFTLLSHGVNGLSIAWGALPAEVCRSADAAVRIVCTPFPATRAFMMVVALVMLVSVWLLLTRTRIGLVIQAALTHPEAVETLGHNVPRIFMLVFGAGTALAGLAGVVAGSTFLTEPSMAATMGTMIFVAVVVGGMGSLPGAFLASLLIGLMQSFALESAWTLGGGLQRLGITFGPAAQASSLFRVTVSQLAGILPYLLMVLILIFRPKGLMGKRED